MPPTEGPVPTKSTPGPVDSAGSGAPFGRALAGAGLIMLVGIGTLFVASRYPGHAVWAVGVDLLLIAAVLILTAGAWRQIDGLATWARRMRDGDFSARLQGTGSAFAPLARDSNAVSADVKEIHDVANRRADGQKQLVRLAGKTQSLDVLYAIATSLGQPGTLDQLLDSFLDTFIELIDARAASVRVVEDGHTRIIASRGLEPAVVECDRQMPLGRCHCGWCATEGGIRIQQGTARCAELVGRPMLERDCQEFVVVPVQHQDRILGVYNLFLDRPLSAMGEDMHDLLISVGRHLGLALEKARLDNDARRLALMEERTLIGSELHDSLAQALVSMRLQVTVLGESLERKDSGAAESEVRNLRMALDEAHAKLRDLLANFRLKISERGFAPAIADTVQRFEQETGIAVFFQNECRTLDLNSAQEVQVFYIIQEALTNNRKHSKARNVRIMLNNEDDFYTVLIEDDGVGMADVTQGIPGERMGLAIMRERSARLPGQLVIESDPEEGTRIVLMFTAPPPVSREPALRS